MLKKSAYIRIFITIVLAASIPIILYKLSYTQNEGKNGFNRIGDTTKIVLSSSIAMPQIATHVAGVTDSCIFFSTRVPGIVLEKDLSLNDKRVDTIPEIYNHVHTLSFSISIDSSMFSFFEGNDKKIYIGDWTNKKIEDSLNTKQIFTRSILISRSSFALRGFIAGRTFDQVFIKSSLLPDGDKMEDSVSLRKGDAGISTDGLLSFDRSSGTVLYTLFYGSQIWAMDTDMRIRYRMHTIDTFNTVKTKAGNVGLDKSYSRFANVTPRYLFNIFSMVSNGKIYLASRLKADNESEEMFRDNSVIDVYDIGARKYVKSLYLPKIPGDHLSEFFIREPLIIAIYHHHIATYRITP